MRGRTSPTSSGRSPRSSSPPRASPSATSRRTRCARRPAGSGLVTADKPESQEICFIPDDDYRGFLRRRVPEAFRPGPIVDGTGSGLGAPSADSPTTRSASAVASAWRRAAPALRHRARPRAQRRGGGPRRGAGDRPALGARQVNLIAVATLERPLDVDREDPPQPRARRRRRYFRPSRGPGSKPRRGAVRTSPSARSRPGQSVVFYQGELVVGGGVIARANGEGA